MNAKFNILKKRNKACKTILDLVSLTSELLSVSDVTLSKFSILRALRLAQCFQTWPVYSVVRGE